ncbi:macro domain-containing protein [Deinococcus frigens]|uniref:type II toxin-antitoxin system antitoxin DNA ADP-ribosyl glycohydrolase DarG n=1 Tax=Deinococcus frigens TaxID=249403 RepID=UPI00068D38B0|nr:macro domain-containing protein [Deinococcus frigens]
MIRAEQGNLLDAKAMALVNTVNTVGVMGKGIALQFKRAFPDNYREYVQAVKKGEVQIGKMFVTQRPPLYTPQFIINFPTKQHWREKSQLEYITAGLEDLVQTLLALEIKSVAIPPLGCGHGGLDWDEVRPLIVQALNALPDVEVLLYSPDATPEALAMPNAKKIVSMTRWRALMIKLIDLYLIPDYFLGRIEAMKLAYFIQAAGEDMKLNFRAARFGPYSERVQHALEDMEGTFIQGLGDGSGRSQIQLMPGAVQAANAFLAEESGSGKANLEAVAELIAGFETSYTMELLSSVHWVATEQGATTWEEALEKVGQWSDRKKQMMEPYHVQVAWEQLAELGWLERSVRKTPSVTHRI